MNIGNDSEYQVNYWQTMFPKAFLIILSFCVAIQAATEDYYKGAVVEFAPHINNVTENTILFLEYIRKASEQEADIIVFPEIGLNGYGPCNEEMFTQIPDPTDKLVLCDNGNFSAAIQAISCAAKDERIYVVVNVAEIVLCPMKDCSPKGRLRYNTNVVFDRSGAVIARYRKFHLFGELGTDRTPNPELSFFDTDFGVRFGTFICFDMMFNEPAVQLVKELGIHNIVFSTAWFSELPFLTALQAQSMWSYAMDVNLLASGYNAPEVGSCGSGIYQGKAGPIVMTFPETTTSKLLTADIPKNPKSRHIKPYATNPIQSVDSSTVYLKRDYLEYCTTSLLKDMKPTSTICNNKLCCEFEIIYTAPKDGTITHRALVFDGVRTFDGIETGGTQICAVISCTNDTLNGCGIRTNSDFAINHIKISGSFENEASLQMPSTLRQNTQLEPLNSDEFSFTSDCNVVRCNVTMTTTKAINNILTFGVYNRVFSRDGNPVTTGGVNKLIISQLSFLLSILINVLY